MKAMSLIIGACIIIILMAAVLTGLVSFRGASYTEPHNVTTGAGVTTASVILADKIMDSELGFVTITSNNTGDAPAPTTYTDATKVLDIDGLIQNTTHQLQVTYKYNQLNSYFGADISSKTVPVMLILGVLGIIVGAVVAATRGRSD